MKRRRHHNNKGYAGIKAGYYEEDVRKIADKMSLPFGKNLVKGGKRADQRSKYLSEKLEKNQR